MSERQRLVTKYVTGIFAPMKVKYHLHLCRNEKDHGAAKTLVQYINEQGVKNASIAAARERSSTVFGKWNQVERGSENREAPDRLMESYHIERALLEYERTKDHDADQFTRERLTCLFILDRNQEAFDICWKSDYPNMNEIAMMVCFSVEEWDEAMKWATRYSASMGRKQTDQAPLLTEWDGAHLVALAVLATGRCEFIDQYIAQLESCLIDLTEVIRILKLFRRRSFLELRTNMSTIEQWAHDSLCTCNVEWHLVQRIRQNIVENAVRPYSVIQVADIERGKDSLEKEIGYDPSEYLKHGILEGRIRGKVDFVGNLFLAGDNNAKTWEYIDRTVICREKFQNAQWLDRYKHT